MPASVSRRSLFPLAAELICARLTLSAITSPAGEDRACEQAAVLESKPGVRDRAIGEAHAKALILPPCPSIVASPVFRGQGKGRQLDLIRGRSAASRRLSLRVNITSC